jgi:hypothetical protein
MADIPSWQLKGEWFDVCRCAIPCPCTFAQAPTFEHCEGTMAYHVRDGRYGDVALDGLNVIILNCGFTGNAWADPNVKVAVGMFLDERADEHQREALQMIFSGEAGGWPAQFAQLIDDMRGIEIVPIEFDVADDLSWWSAKIPGRVDARGEAITGPTAQPDQRIQLHNVPGSEVGPGAVATMGVAVIDEAEGFDVKWSRTGQAAKHMNFDWSGPDQ